MFFVQDGSNNKHTDNNIRCGLRFDWRDCSGDRKRRHGGKGSSFEMGRGRWTEQSLIESSPSQHEVFYVSFQFYQFVTDWFCHFVHNVSAPNQQSVRRLTRRLHISSLTYTCSSHFDWCRLKVCERSSSKNSRIHEHHASRHKVCNVDRECQSNRSQHFLFTKKKVHMVGFTGYHSKLDRQLSDRSNGRASIKHKLHDRLDLEPSLFFIVIQNISMDSSAQQSTTQVVTSV